MRPEELESSCGVDHPMVHDLLAVSSITQSRPVFSHSEDLQWLAPNVLFEIPPNEHYGSAVVVTNVILVFSAGFFLAPTNPGILMSDLGDLRWGELRLPCDAHRLIDYVNQNGIGRAHLVTESEAAGVSAWKAHLGALTFEFQPKSGGIDPRQSDLISIAYAFNLPHTAALGPTLCRD